MQSMRLAAALVEEVAAQGGRLWIDGDAIEVAASAPLSADLIEQLRLHKPHILALSRQCVCCFECGQPILERVAAWWGGEPVHRECGERAWERKCKALLAGKRVPANEAAT